MEMVFLLLLRGRRRLVLLVDEVIEMIVMERHCFLFLTRVQ